MDGCERNVLMKKEDQRDLLEFLHGILGCIYLSDLALEPYNTRAKMLLRYLDLTRFPLKELNEAAAYLYRDKQDFTCYEQANAYFSGTR